MWRRQRWLVNLVRTEEMSLLGCDIPDTHRPGGHSNFFSRGGGKRWRLRGDTAGLVRSRGAHSYQMFHALRKVKAAILYEAARLGAKVEL